MSTPRHWQGPEIEENLLLIFTLEFQKTLFVHDNQLCCIAVFLKELRQPEVSVGLLLVGGQLLLTKNMSTFEKSSRSVAIPQKLCPMGVRPALH